MMLLAQNINETGISNPYEAAVAIAVIVGFCFCVWAVFKDA